MPIFTAIAAAVTWAATAIGFSAATAAAIGAFAVRTVLTIGISSLLSKRAGGNATGSQDSGARVQLPPATSNKVPVVYGSAYIAPTITDAKISTDQKFMWYVCTLSEVTDSGSFTYGNILYNGKTVQFDGSTAKVVSLTTNSDPVQVDTTVDGKLYIYKFTNGSSSGVNTGGLTAIQIMSDASTGGGIPYDERWTGPIYTTGGESADMTNLAFLIVRMEYNTDAGLTGLGTLNVQLQNSLDKPVIKVETITLNDILEQNNAPNFIDYLTLDTEGSELIILNSVNFDKYKFGLIHLEHNYVEPRRTDMKNLLISKGYKYIGENQWDDEYSYEEK
jgi:hypothetical protein